MISNYFTLSALAHEWSDILSGAVIRDVYSPHKDELAIDFSADGETETIRISVRPGFHFIYRGLRAGRPRSNVATLFGSLIGETIAAVDMNPSDRILMFDLGPNRRMDIHLYGSRANVFLISKEPDGEHIEDAFKRSAKYQGESPPLPKELPKSELKDALKDDDVSTVLEKRLSRLRPRLGKPLIREWILRAGIDGDVTGALPEDSVERLESSLTALLSDLEAPSPALYHAQDDEI
ncbi:MAG: NFACT family protein, partial [Rhodothermales bacterium]